MLQNLGISGEDADEPTAHPMLCYDFSSTAVTSAQETGTLIPSSGTRMMNYTLYRSPCTTGHKDTLFTHTLRHCRVSNHEPVFCPVSERKAKLILNT